MVKLLYPQDIHVIANIIASIYANPANEGAESVIKAKYPTVEPILDNFPILYSLFYNDSVKTITEYNDDFDYEGLYEYLEGSGGTIISDPVYWVIADLICHISNYGGNKED